LILLACNLGYTYVTDYFPSTPAIIPFSTINQHPSL